MERRLQAALILVFAVAAPIVGADDVNDILFEKEDLEEIQGEVNQSRQRLDSLKREEIAIQKSVTEYDQKIATNRKLVSRLTRQLADLKSEVSRSGSELDSVELVLDLTRRRYLGDIRQFYLSTRTVPDRMTATVNGELELNRRVVYLTALAGYESGNVVQAGELLEDSRLRLRQLSSEKKRVSALKKKKETATVVEASKKEKEQRALEQVRRKKSEEADRILTLELAAQELERIIARLESERSSVTQSEYPEQEGPSAFSTLEGLLPSPCRGRIVKGFGHFQDEVTRLKSFSPGITIDSKPGQDVMAVADGTVVYIGDLRGYDTFVIIDHGDQYYSTYGGLGKSLVSLNEYVLGETAVGVAGSSGLVKFELRHRREPLDPVKWIRFDAF